MVARGLSAAQSDAAVCKNGKGGNGSIVAERLMNIFRGAASILDIWPNPATFEEISPRDAEEMFRDCWCETGAALRSAVIEFDLDLDLEEAPEGQVELNATGVEC